MLMAFFIFSKIGLIFKMQKKWLPHREPFKFYNERTTAPMQQAHFRS
jgi:hypothetical protein